jgi:hypothetical protein
MSGCLVILAVRFLPIAVVCAWFWLWTLIYPPPMPGWLAFPLVLSLLPVWMASGYVVRRVLVNLGLWPDR